MTTNRSTQNHFIGRITSMLALAMLLPAFAAACPSVYNSFSADSSNYYVTTTISDSGSTSVAAYAEVSIDGGSSSDLWNTGTTYASASVQKAYSGNSGSGISQTTDPGDDGEGASYIASGFAHTYTQSVHVYSDTNGNCVQQNACTNGTPKCSIPSIKAGYSLVPCPTWYETITVVVNNSCVVGIGTWAAGPGACTLP